MITPVPDVNTLKELRAKKSVPLALVPTMGALHEGHLALIRQARKLVGSTGTVAVSIFVNPIQFDRASDLSNYPRPLEQDLVLCEKEGVDLAFIPKKSSLYHPDHSVLLSESLLSQHLCGTSRPGHFDGVLTVVLKLFNLFQPDFAVFGKKDFQQLALINRMVRDLNLSVEVIGHPTVRENDGLALSSRNCRLSPSQRADASRIHHALSAARDIRTTGEQDPSILLGSARSRLLRDAPKDFSIDYLELVDAETLQPVASMTRPTVLATACFYGEVRLIDHIAIRG